MATGVVGVVDDVVVELAELLSAVMVVVVVGASTFLDAAGPAPAFASFVEGPFPF
jgi:hypothetical protein